MLLKVVAEEEGAIWFRKFRFVCMDVEESVEATIWFRKFKFVCMDVEEWVSAAEGTRWRVCRGVSRSGYRYKVEGCREGAWRV